MEEYNLIIIFEKYIIFSMRLYGVHGTCEEFARSIFESNFRQGEGRGGSGAYFWKKNKYFKCLSKGWYDYCLKKNQYKNCIKNNFACISVLIEVDKKNFIDLETEKIKNKIECIVHKRKYKRFVDKSKINALYNYILKKIEEEHNTKIYAWQLRCSIPSNVKDYPVEILGNPMCYVVRNITLISIINCLVMEGNNEKEIFKNCG